MTSGSDYILRCSEKIAFHKANGINSSIWNNFLSTSSIFLSALTACTITILTVYDASNEAVVITTSVYAFLITLVNKLKDSYSFLALSFQHYNLQDQFAEIQVDLFKAIHDNDELAINNLIYKYTLIEQKSHIQTVKCSNCMRCCLRN